MQFSTQEIKTRQLPPLSAENRSHAFRANEGLRIACANAYMPGLTIVGDRIEKKRDILLQAVRKNPSGMLTLDRWTLPTDVILPGVPQMMPKECFGELILAESAGKLGLGVKYTNDMVYVLEPMTPDVLTSMPEHAYRFFLPHNRDGIPTMFVPDSQLHPSSSTSPGLPELLYTYGCTQLHASAISTSLSALTMLPPRGDTKKM